VRHPTLWNVAHSRVAPIFWHVAHVRILECEKKFAGVSTQPLAPVKCRLPQVSEKPMGARPRIGLSYFYLRAAQAYMLISMPTGTSTIFGVFQAMTVSPVLGRIAAKKR
jgi:hypothetical protein